MRSDGVQRMVTLEAFNYIYVRDHSVAKQSMYWRVINSILLFPSALHLVEPSAVMVASRRGF